MLNLFGKYVKEKLSKHNKKCWLNKLFSCSVIKKEYSFDNINLNNDVIFIIFEYIGSEILNNKIKYDCESFKWLDRTFDDKNVPQKNNIIINNKRILDDNEDEYIIFKQDFIERDYIINHECSDCSRKVKRQRSYYDDHKITSHNKTTFITKTDQIYNINIKTYETFYYLDDFPVIHHIVNVDK